MREGFPRRDLIVRPGYIVGPGDTSDRFTYWPVRIARGGEVLVPGRRTDRVQYIDVRDLAAWMVRLFDQDAAGTFNAVGPATPQTLAQFIDGLKPLAPVGTAYTWIEDYEWLKKYPLRTATPDDAGGLTEAIPWVMADGTELGHMRISNRKALAAGLTYRPLLDHGARHAGLAAERRRARGAAQAAEVRDDGGAGDGDSAGVEN